jgi:hypothetical protein
MVVGVGEGVGGSTVGLGVASVRVGDGVGAAVDDGDGEVVGDERLDVGVPETAGLGLAAGAPQAATRATISSAAIG